MKKFLPIVIIFACILTVYAQAPSNARIDINGYKDKITFSNISTLDTEQRDWHIKTHSWDKEREMYGLYTNFPLSPKTWTQIGFKFTPLVDGEVIIVILGYWYKPEGAEKNLPVFAYYDALEVTGAEVMDGDFEEVNENGKLTYWDMRKNEPNAEVVTDPNYVKSGKQSVKVWHDSHVCQKISVKANQEVVIKAWAYVE